MKAKVPSEPQSLATCAMRSTELRGGSCEKTRQSKVVRCCSGDGTGNAATGVEIGRSGESAGKSRLPQCQGPPLPSSRVPNQSSLQAVRANFDQLLYAALFVGPPHGFRAPGSDVTTNPKHSRVKKACSPGHPIAAYHFAPSGIPSQTDRP